VRFSGNEPATNRQRTGEHLATNRRLPCNYLETNWHPAMTRSANEQKVGWHLPGNSKEMPATGDCPWRGRV